MAKAIEISLGSARAAGIARQMALGALRDAVEKRHDKSSQERSSGIGDDLTALRPPPDGGVTSSP
jgi:hypothetical protein